MIELLDQLKAHRLVPVVAIDSAADAVPMAEALREGGLPVVEITFRTTAALESIRAIAKRGNVVVGAGTVLSVETAKAAMDAGASFIVMPGFSAKIVEFCLAKGHTVIPGVSTPTDLMAAAEFGLSVLKFFPAETLGGVKALRALSAPFGGMKFVPTGGITHQNLRSYLDEPMVLACGGSWMVGREMIAAKQFDRIRQLTVQAVALARGTRDMNHII
jgi:2-dehydro-3-deoxyphosphogluconate aldolase/(4S)-4-hydroxy-2-oxoglutarate aldolase